MRLIEYLNIEQDGSGTMVLPFEKRNLNYLGTAHAAAQFALAEFASGQYLQKQFPEYAGEVTGVVRKSKLRYRNPGRGRLHADVSIEDVEKAKLILRLKNRGMSPATLKVIVRDEEGSTSLEAEFEWFLSRSFGSSS